MKLSATFTSLLSLVSLVAAQQVGTQTAENHPSLSWQKCTKSGGCSNQAGSVTLDSNWRWLHTTSGYTNCFTGSSFDSSLCPDGVTCAKNCALDGADYSGTYGITTSGNALTLKFKTGTNVGSRVYLMASDSAYQMFKLKNQEFTFDVDMSNLGCGLNGALYFVEMDADGGKSKFANNKAGAKYGTGYCDSQCPHDIKFINGEANVDGWSSSPNDPNAGKGKYGTCCSEMDIWEANKYASAYTPHGCTVTGQTRCEGNDCGDGSNRYGGVCDKDGCDFNSYRMGDTSFLGPGSTVDTTKKITVVTQFITSDGTANGALKEIRRVYVQNNKVIGNSKTNIAGMAAYDSITEEFCSAQKTAFGDNNDFGNKGGFSPMDASMTRGMVLVLSVWDDHDVNMLWLDSTYPTDSTNPGAARGSCPTDSGKPADVESQQANASVIFSNIKFGDIDSTYSGTTTSSSSSSTSRSSSSTSRSSSSTSRSSSSSTRTTSTSTTRSSSSSTRTTTSAPAGQTLWGQCGGQGWNGPTTCAQGTCKYSNPWYSQCLN